MGNLTDGEKVDRLKDVLPDLVGPKKNSEESYSPVLNESVSRSNLNQMMDFVKNKTKPHLVFLNENKEPVTQLRRENFENSDSQDVKKLQEEFYLQLEDPAQAGKGSIKVNLWASDQAEKVRTLDEVILYETSPGKFISKAQLLVKKKNEEGFLPDLFEDFNPVKKYEVGLGETILAEDAKGQLRAKVTCVPTTKLVQVAPAVLNENGQLVSTLPQQPPAVNLMTEANSAKDRVAYREIQIQLDKSLVGRTVTWSMKPLPFSEAEASAQAVLQGDLKVSPNHKDYFESSKDLGESKFQRVSQNEAKTLIDAEGLTAVRTNLPPIAFNKAQVKIQVEGIPVAQEAANFIVPAVVAIDPGHGGTKDIGGSDANHAVSPSGVKEKEMTLDFSRRLRDRLIALGKEQNLPIIVHLARDEDKNLSLEARANLARDVGADNSLTIHFNGFNAKSRGTETYIRNSGNVNAEEDKEFASRIQKATFGAIQSHDPKAVDRGIKTANFGTLSDASLGNTKDYHPTKSAYLEMEFIDVKEVDELLNTGEDHERVRENIVNKMAGAILEDLKPKSKPVLRKTTVATRKQ